MKIGLSAAKNEVIPLFFVFLALMTGEPRPLQAQNRRLADYREVYVSPDVKCHQGYATDGTNHYTFDNQVIYKWRGDQKWSLIASNNTPFAGISGLNHFGDGDYFEGKLYIVAEFWASCTGWRFTIFPPNITKSPAWPLLHLKARAGSFMWLPTATDPRFSNMTCGRSNISVPCR